MQSEQQILQLKLQLTSKLRKLQDGHSTLAVEAANMPSQLHDNCILIFSVKENMQLSKMLLYGTGPSVEGQKKVGPTHTKKTLFLTCVCWGYCGRNGRVGPLPTTPGCKKEDQDYLQGTATALS